MSNVIELAPPYSPLMLDEVTGRLIQIPEDTGPEFIVVDHFGRAHCIKPTYNEAEEWQKMHLPLGSKIVEF